MDVLQFIDEHRNGILATVAFHLLVLVIFFYVQVNKNNRISEQNVLLEIQQETPEEVMKNPALKKVPIQTPIYTVAHRGGMNIGRNVPVNVGDKNLKDKISTEKYVEEVKQELNIKDLNPHYDADKILSSKAGEASVSIPQHVQKATEKKVTYKGKTNIYYDLPGRSHIDLPIPIYKCEGGGEVCINIVVDERGYVTSAAVSTVKSSYTDECFAETALRAATHSTFTPKSGSAKQKGTLTYEFIPQ
ncbi:MAG: hypothetical protein Q8907_11445 [Bacteroidota bacterium]|nr:hypothetical protein [Bacteroidota bacterium]MDP4226812.1 hypothetical protein [Bacteroidota bacterium]MDP4274881.1 hypothetical protein [Bacteroidota bacterium]